MAGHHDHRGHGSSVSDTVRLGSFGAAGWSGLVADLVAVSRQLRVDHADLPLFLIGHSMGSFALQEVVLDHSDLYAGVVLSGSTALDVLAIRSDLPILLVSGDADPLAGGGQLIEILSQRYADAGVTDVTVHLFPGARHEIVNETNRDEVTRKVIDWLNARTGTAGSC